MIDLIKCLRIGTVPRWTIIPMTKTQSVAEHSYNVWLITGVLYDKLYPIPHNSPEKALALEYALIHDLAEVITGDIPSPAKQAIHDHSPGLMDLIEDAALHSIYPKMAGVVRAVKGTAAASIVKMADYVEALAFVGKFGADGGEAAYGVRRAFWKFLEGAQKQHPTLDWPRALEYLYGVFPDLLGPDPEG